MSGNRPPLLELEDGTRAGTLAHVAEALNTSSRQINTWASRRERNGSPAPLDPAVTGDARNRRYDVDDWLAWRITYEPSHGGAPPGNTYAVRHGRYCGTEARRTRSGTRPAA